MECFECRFLKAPPFSNNAYRITLHSSWTKISKNYQPSLTNNPNHLSEESRIHRSSKKLRYMYKVIRILVCQLSRHDSFHFLTFFSFITYILEKSYFSYESLHSFGNYLCFQFYTIETNTCMVKRRMWKF